MLNIKNATVALIMLVSVASWAEQADAVAPVAEPQSMTAVMSDAKPVEASKASDHSSVDINTANAKQLSQLSNIGLKKAQQIVDYRALHGQFTSIDDLQKVKGIGKSTIEKNRSRIMVAAQ